MRKRALNNANAQGALTVLHLSLLPMNSLNQTQTAIFTLMLHLLLPGDHITRIYLANTVRTRTTTLAETGQQQQQNRKFD